MLSTLLLSLVLSGRFAVLATASEAPGQAPLRYVEADADRVAAVFEELGGLDAKNVFRVPHATVTSLREALLKAEAAVRSDPNAVLLIYFSGHADEGGLLLGDESFEYRELRQYLKQSSARTRVVLLDGCRTGGAVTAKGGHQGAAFDVRPLQADAITEVISGAAIIAASTATEQAQESSRLEGSFFTHHLVAGLRGAADQNGDGRITLAESYAYAYKQTLSSTSSTLFGPQHAAYQYDLAGTGELTLTELARAEAILSLPLGAPGDRYLVFDKQDSLVAEVAGGGRRPASLAVRAGSYRVTRRRDGRAAVATVGLAVGTTRSLEEGELREQPTELAMAKGVRRKRHAVFLDGAFVYAQTGAIPTALEAGLSYSYVLPRWQLLGRVAYGGGESSYEEYQVTRTSAQAALLRRLPLATIELAAGLEGGVAHFEQTRQGREDLLPRVPDHLQGTAASAHAVLVVDIPLGGPMSLALGWRGGAILLRGNDALRVRAELLTNIAVGAHF